MQAPPPTSAFGIAIAPPQPAPLPPAPLPPAPLPPAPLPPAQPLPTVLDVLQRTTHVEIPGLEFSDITVTGHWEEFTSANIISAFGHLLTGTDYTYCNPITSLHSPVLGVYDENAVTLRLSPSVLQPLRRCLRLVFAAHPQPQAAGAGELLPRDSKLSAITHDAGSAAIFPGKELPDYSSCAPPPPLRASRLLPGDCKVDWKGRADWFKVKPAVTNITEKETREYRQVLSQLYYYMFKTKARYGYIITNGEVLCMRAVNSNDSQGYGSVEVSASYPLVRDPTVTHSDPGMTPLLALMGLHLLAAADDHWSMSYNFPHPRLGARSSARRMGL
ncbi:hypothetical protein FN846DRAFT_783022 [Sphaerosporella brunnea]|uniref:Uncharacterized protein n=1 Tax=Sphaerosporella brunnea TaxID=1250544 RepID=A0A5J5ENW6_9PEZI|nr:hypothetical protein FN846DRAFT_783022 [Sphaerosporella brunnea]